MSYFSKPLSLYYVVTKAISIPQSSFPLNCPQTQDVVYSELESILLQQLVVGKTTLFS